MLGHTTIRTTQIYAKVVEQKVSQDTTKLRDLIGIKAPTALLNPNQKVFGPVFPENGDKLLTRNH